MTQGTCNGGDRGNTKDRRARKEWMVSEFRADVDLTLGDDGFMIEVDRGEGIPACRCYRCGELLTVETVTPDRWPIPGCKGGTYRRNNIRPACSTCQSITGNEIKHTIKKKKEASHGRR